MKTAIIHVPHNPCEDSLKHMLESVGYRVFRLPKKALKTMMTHCRQNVKKRLPEATWKQFMNADLLVVIKHFSVAKVRKSWPHLKDRVLWFDINGGQPSANPPTYKHFKLASPAPYVGSCKDMNDPAVSGPRYVCYIPLADRPMFEVPRTEKQHPPICLVTNVHNWGYGGLAALVAKSGVVRMYGGHTKRGMIPYAKVPQYLSSATCYVHIKSRDCPGFSLYQAMAAKCPVVLSSNFVERTQYTDLYEDEKTCLFLHDSNDKDMTKRMADMHAQIVVCTKRFEDRAFQRRIGEAAADRLREVLWNKERDAEGFGAFMKDNFP